MFDQVERQIPLPPAAKDEDLVAVIITSDYDRRKWIAIEYRDKRTEEVNYAKFVGEFMVGLTV